MTERAVGRWLIPLLALGLVWGCAGSRREPNTTKQGAATGATTGAVGAVELGERELDEILAGSAIGDGVGAGSGAYMDRQEERLVRLPGTSVERVAEDMILLRFDSDILFEVDSATLDLASRRSLDEAADALIGQPKTAIISQGHTDATGSENHNLELATRRAEAVRAHLIARGVDPGRIIAVGYGEGYPLASNAIEEGRRHNRRVDLLLKVKAR
jgi:outer membrane protein OmpA-like peptidoglycan-associated protein